MEEIREEPKEEEEIKYRKSTQSLQDFQQFSRVESCCFRENCYLYYEFLSIVSQGLTYFAEKNGTVIGFIICAKSDIEDYIEIEEYETIQMLLQKYVPQRTSSLRCLASRKKQKYIHIFGLAVLPEHRNKGIGHNLLKKIISYQEKYRRPLLLEVRVSNINAISLYKKVGFQTTVTLANYYPDAEAAYVLLRVNQK